MHKWSHARRRELYKWVERSLKEETKLERVKHGGRTMWHIVWWKLPPKQVDMLMRDCGSHSEGKYCVWTSCSLFWVLSFTPSALGERDAILKCDEHWGPQKRRCREKGEMKKMLLKRFFYHLLCVHFLVCEFTCVYNCGSWGFCSKCVGCSCGTLWVSFSMLRCAAASNRPIGRFGRKRVLLVISRRERWWHSA